MLRIQESADEDVVLTLIGRMDSEDLPELKTLCQPEAEGRRVVLDLKDLTLVDRDAVRFLKHCEAGNIQLTNCPAYIREWIKRERQENDPR